MPEQTRNAFLILTVSDLNAVNNAQKSVFAELEKTWDSDLRKSRDDAYFLRWKEALVYIDDGADLLDIGGGWLRKDILNHIVGERGINYHLVDIDPAIVADRAAALANVGLPADQSKLSDNTNLPFASGRFDFVFSSHCLEHSVDLAATFKEIRRVLKPGGHLFFAVPFGFDDADEHNYFLGIDEWIEVTSAAGFEVLNQHVGRVYPYAGWDLAIIAKLQEGDSQLDRVHSLAARYRKAGRTLVRHTDPIFHFRDGGYADEDFGKLPAIGAKCVIRADDPLTSLLMLRHAWSGIVEVSDGNARRIVDCFSRIPHIAAIDVSDMEAPLTVTVLAPSAHSHASQGVIYGAVLN